MIIAYHSVLILDKEITIVLMCPERIPAIVHPPPPRKKRKNSFTVPHKDKQIVFEDSRYDMLQNLLLHMKWQRLT